MKTLTASPRRAPWSCSWPVWPVCTYLRGFWDKTFRLAVSGNVKALAEYLRSFGSYAVLVSFVIDVLINMGSVFPSVFVSTANGLIFGLPLGVTISWLAETVGVVFSFLLMRFFSAIRRNA